MTTIEAIEQHLEAGDLQAIEDEWLDHLERDDIDLSFFDAVARLLERAGEGDHAAFLLDLLVDQVGDDPARRLELLRDMGDHLFPEPAALHEEMLRLLEERFGAIPAFSVLAEKVGLHRAIEDIPKGWTKADRLADILAYPDGTIVLMQGQGPGRVVELNTALDSFKIEIYGKGPVRVGFAAARKMLGPLSDGHILYRKLTDPEALEQLLQSDPEELAHEVFSSYDQPLAANEIREALSGIVSEKKWTSFWNRVRKSPRLISLPGGKQRYRWAETADDAVTQLEARFAAADIKERLDLLRQHADRDQRLRRSMVEALTKEAELLLDREPAAAFRIALALERAGEELQESSIGPDSILASISEPLSVAASIAEAKTREEFFRRLPALRGDWPVLFARAITKEEEARVLDLLSDRLGETDPAALATALGQLLNQPRRNPGGFTWLAERAAEDETILCRAPLRLFQQIVSATADKDFAVHKKRLLALVESGSTLPRLLPHLQAEQAERAAEVVDRASGLDAYQKKLLINAIHLRFPELHQDTDAPLYATAASIVAQEEKLRKLLEEEIPANRRAIEEARELGDLRENFEYKSARQRHEYLAAIAATLAQDLERSKEIPLSGTEPESIRIGTRAVLVDPDGVERSITILGPWESDPENGILSNESELAQSLLGLALGDDTEIEGRPFSVRAIEPVAQEA